MNVPVFVCMCVHVHMFRDGHIHMDACGLGGQRKTLGVGPWVPSSLYVGQLHAFLKLF